MTPPRKPVASRARFALGVTINLAGLAVLATQAVPLLGR